ncbi:hypothetical protein F2P81_021488 [Scophthalmus maximus]|uniref:Uncharacterized protein n=1 Tax=Scophthalmus maximus TaxID=52904 RepID=A0A6A4S6I7_SCOMX|nr:hypothetical protein F2P81_021488 [Scophthalmus maximus]
MRTHNMWTARPQTPVRHPVSPVFVTRRERGCRGDYDHDYETGTQRAHPRCIRVNSKTQIILRLKRSLMPEHEQRPLGFSAAFAVMDKSPFLTCRRNPKSEACQLQQAAVLEPKLRFCVDTKIQVIPRSCYISLTSDGIYRPELHLFIFLGEKMIFAFLRVVSDVQERSLKLFIHGHEDVNKEGL